jgi:hypothetical protein
VTSLGGTARQIALIVQRDPAGGLPETEVRAQVAEWGLDAKTWRQCVFVAYRKGWVGFGHDQARGYLLAPPDGHPARLTARAPTPTCRPMIEVIT